MPVRIGEAVWNGNFLNGNGIMRSKAGTFELSFSVGSRFENQAGANPEELIGAAHAGCFSMALTKELNDAGFSPESISTKARVHLEKTEKGFSITRIALLSQVKCPGITDNNFSPIFQNAQLTCPVSKALSVPISYEAELV